MSSQDNTYKSSTIGQLLLVIPGTILAFTLLISLIAKTSGVVGAPAAEPAAAAVAKVEENIKPVAAVQLATADAGPHVDKNGEEVVKAVCSMCHAAGLMNAPKIGDKAAWAPRIAQGYDTLISHAINGIRSMPAKGGNAALSDGEIANAVAHMANLGGANFTPPKAKDAAAPADSAAAPTPAPTAEAAAVAAPVVAAAVEATKTAPVEKAAKKAEVKATEAKAKVAEKSAEVAAPVAEKAAVVETKVEPKAEPVAAAPEAAKTGKEVFKTTCAMCHGTGLMGAPKFGDKDAWAPRIAQGYDTLVNHAVHGIRAMPAKGGNEDWSDKEIGNAVKYMANEAGAGF